MKILLILAAGRHYREAARVGKPHRYYAPTTLLQLAALIPSELNAEVTIIDEGIEPLPDEFNADLVGISTITCAAPEAYKIATNARSRGIKVVIGGPHPTLFPEESLRYADSVVVGYAENTWPKLLNDFKKNQLKKIYEDFSSPFSKKLPVLDYSMQKRKKYFTTNTIEVTKGCPNSCNYCAIPRMTRGRFWVRSVREVVEEIENIGKNVLFLDASPTELTEYVRKLWQELIPLNINWYSGATMRLTENPEMLKLAAKSGCKGVLLGFESMVQESLNGINKGFNKVSQYQEAVKRFHDYNISILGCFTFGFDQDDTSVFEKTVEFVNTAKIDIVKYSILTPLPGTPLFHKLKEQGRILTEDWELYDGEHTVFRPYRMSVDELTRGFHWAYKETYKLSSMMKRILKKGSPLVNAVLGNLVFRRLANSR